MTGERIDGCVKLYVKDRRYLFLYDQTGVDYFCHEDNLTAPNGHHCLYKTGVPVTFQVKPANGKHTTQAFDVQMVDIPELLEREDSTVTSWFNTYGFAERECPGRCSVFLHIKDIASDMKRYRPDDECLRVGDRINHQTTENFHNSRLVAKAVDIEVYQ
jgi:hypothetical protein